MIAPCIPGTPKERRRLPSGNPGYRSRSRLIKPKDKLALSLLMR